jgi:hypothetical protein
MTNEGGKKRTQRNEYWRAGGKPNIRFPDEYVLVKDCLPLALAVVRRGIVYDL